MDATIVTTRGGRVVSADAAASAVLNCPPAVLRGAYFPAFVREPKLEEVVRLMAARSRPGEERKALLKPLGHAPRSVTLRVEHHRVQPGPRRVLLWTVRERHAAAPGQRPPPAGPGRALLVERAAAQEEAARTMGRELHDEAGQLMATLQLVLDTATCETPCGCHPSVDQARALLHSIEGELRRLAHQLRPAVLDDLGLEPALRSLAAGVSARGLDVTVDARLEPPLPEDVELHLYRIAQEALTNALRHSGARRATLHLSRRRGQAVLRISDDGCGLRVSPASSRGLGLLTMTERAAVLGGRLQIETPPGSGLAVEVTVPLGGACAS